MFRPRSKRLCSERSGWLECHRSRWKCPCTSHRRKARWGQSKGSGRYFNSQATRHLSCCPRDRNTQSEAHTDDNASRIHTAHPFFRTKPQTCKSDTAPSQSVLSMKNARAANLRL